MTNETTPQENALSVRAKMNAKNFNDEFFDALEKLSDQELQEVEATYLDFTEGQVENLIFTGFQKGKFSGNNGFEEKQMCCFEAKGGIKKVCANSVLVNSLEKVKQAPPFPVRITCTGEQKNASGNKYKTFKIQVLSGSVPPPKDDLPF